ncbi:YetF domain-containing protein [uncultured Gemmiger sp.]|uniref:DUF421 domain-containing protein n=1 Tax=uncultured Gemmiger sp. TaxID=1623490 RepID=UPI0025FDBF4E|nr:YetF domain-containing protein [uncultured Gemmiger sp.]
MLSSITRTCVIYIVAIAALRLMGKRQIGELQPSELVTTFLISNVASICIEEPELPLLSSLLPILLLCALEILNSTAAWYLPPFARLLFGKPVTVIRNGHIDEDALRHLRITPNDLAESMRGAGVFTPEDVAWGVIEPSGSLSVAMRPEKGEDAPLLPLLIDRHIYTDNLKALNRDEDWLNAYLTHSRLRRRDVLALLANEQRTLLIPKQTAPGNRQA